MAHGLDISWNPIDAPGVEDPAEAATWASLRICAPHDAGAASVLTEVYARHERSVREEVFGTVLPLAEWLARSWSHITTARRSHPGPVASAEDLYEWDRVHRWRFAGEGTAVPDLCFSRLDDEAAVVAWAADTDESELAFERVRFLSRGATRIPIEELDDCLAGFVEGVIQRLRAAVPDSDRTRELLEAWTLVRNPDAPDHRAQTLAARLGLLWWDMDESTREFARGLASRTLNPVSTQILDSARVSECAPALDFADGLWRRCEGAPELEKAWRRFRHDIDRERPDSDPTEAPWLKGWKAARAYRKVARIEPSEPVEFRELPRRDVRPAAPLPAAADSVIAWDASRTPIRACVRDSSSGAGKLWRRFGVARDLYFFSFGAPFEDAFARVVSRRVAGSSSVANAFAAELLAPVDAVKELVGARRSIDAFEVAAIAATLKAPTTCVRHQVENHRLANVLDAA